MPNLAFKFLEFCNLNGLTIKSLQLRQLKTPFFINIGSSVQINQTKHFLVTEVRRNLFVFFFFYMDIVGKAAK